MAGDLHTQVGRDWLKIMTDPYPSTISYKGECHLRNGSTNRS